MKIGFTSLMCLCALALMAGSAWAQQGSGGKPDAPRAEPGKKAGKVKGAKGNKGAEKSQAKGDLGKVVSPVPTIDNLDPRLPLDRQRVIRFFQQARTRQEALERVVEARTRSAERLNAAQKDLEARYAALRMVQDELEQVILTEQKRQKDEEAAEASQAMGAERQANVARLARVFGKMKPAEASLVVGRMDDDLVVDVLMQIKERQTAKILGALDAAKAANLSEKMAARRGQQKP